MTVMCTAYAAVPAYSFRPDYYKYELPWVKKMIRTERELMLLAGTEISKLKNYYNRKGGKNMKSYVKVLKLYHSRSGGACNIGRLRQNSVSKTEES